MKITIAGSMAFAKEQIDIKNKLEEMGHEVQVSDDIFDYANSPKLKLSFEKELELSLKHDILKTFYKKIADSDALFVCNLNKNNIDGYLGTSMLMEIALAYYLNKKIYLLNDFDKNQGYALEVSIINPVVLNGDFKKII